MKNINNGRCKILEKLPRDTIISCPIAHGEGRFILPPKTRDRDLEKLYENDQLVFRYCHGDGNFAEGEWPINPNGAFHDIAGICNPDGNVLGLMPHPERAYHGYLMPNWTKYGLEEYGDGYAFFETMVRYTERSF